MATFDYSGVPAVVTITNTTTEEIKIPLTAPNFTFALAGSDVLKLRVTHSAELAFYDALKDATPGITVAAEAES